MSKSANQAFTTFTLTLRNIGLRESLKVLVERTDYRFIGIWRFENGKANAAVHYDRENPDALEATEVPDTATYCCFVRESGEPFKTPNALIDERLAKHPARDTVLSYYGVPVMDSDGTIIGTLCHYDFVPRDTAQVDVKLMLNVASYLSLNKMVPPYPGT